MLFSWKSQTRAKHIISTSQVKFVYFHVHVITSKYIINTANMLTYGIRFFLIINNYISNNNLKDTRNICKFFCCVFAKSFTIKK